MSAVLTAALDYAQRGWHVFPCVAGGKVPATKHGLLDASLDRQRITECWTQFPALNVAIRTGKVSGVVVLDVDGDEGMDSLHAWEREHGVLPRTASVVTPRGGHHFYFAYPGVEVRNTQGNPGSGLDVRGDGGYVLAPPSCGPERPYNWDEVAPPAPMPKWLLDAAVRDSRLGRRTDPTVWTTMLREGIPSGQRNGSLTRLAGYLLRSIDVDVAARLVHLVNAHRCRPALAEHEVERILDSIARREARRRLGGVQ